ncbi:MAG TPA: hypothetical protein VGF29_03505 [Hyphomicrobiaceae bacterium]|jgi:hypothetical protein
MTGKLLALGGGALALLLMSGVSSPADAGRGGHAFAGAHHFHAAPHFRSHAFIGHPRFHHRHAHRRIFIGAPFAYGYYAYGDCYWLRRRALHTGSPYWWNRYYSCIGAY